jgi:predicted nucleotidyltransferase component of viral defense system
MNSSEKDYTKLYQLQDNFFAWWGKLDFPFYLTGGTALGRFYLKHRFSDDLDFFINANKHYQKYITELKNKILKHFDVNIQQSLFYEDFARFFISENNKIFLKIEFINDVEYHANNPVSFKYGKIDTPLNILANKLTALVSRDEPKDIVDIIYLSLNYSFDWMNIFHHAKQKALINELDIEQRLNSFSVEWLENVKWLNQSVELNVMRNLLSQIADDFLFGKINSLGKQKIPVESAKPLIIE